MIAWLFHFPSSDLENSKRPLLFKCPLEPIISLLGSSLPCVKSVRIRSYSGPNAGKCGPE